MSCRPIRYAFGCKARVGKDEAAAYIARRFDGVHILRFSEPLYEAVGAMQRAMGQEVKKDPAMLQKVGSLLKEHYGEAIFADALAAKVRALGPDAHIVVADLRFPCELRALEELGFICVRIVRPGRPIDRDPTHISETALDGAPMAEILNDGTLGDFHAAIGRLLGGQPHLPPKALGELYAPSGDVDIDLAARGGHDDLYDLREQDPDASDDDAEILFV